MTVMLPSLENIQRIAILRLSALGDVCMVVPVIRSLQKAMPQVHITWFISRPAYDLVEGMTGVEFIVIDKPQTPLDYLRLRKRLKNAHYDVLLAMQAALRANLIYPFIHAPIKIGFDNARARDGQRWFTNMQIPFSEQHLLDSFMSFAETLGVKEKCIEWQLPLSDDLRTWAKEKLPEGDGKLLIINPAASKTERNWPAQRYADIIKLMHARGVRVLLTGGTHPVERELIAEIKQQLDFPASDRSGQTSPKQLAALLECADCVLAPDTGPVHMAVAVGTPVVGLYAVAPSWLSGPYLQRGHVIDKYDEAVQLVLQKDPATVPWGTRVHSSEAMNLISVAEVEERLQQVLL